MFIQDLLAKVNCDPYIIDAHMSILQLLTSQTTFLDILAKKRKTGTISGRVLINGEQVDNTEIFKKLTGYVDQEDIHIPVLTVQETLEFSAAVRLPESISAAEKSNRVQKVLKQLGLFHIANSRVGDALHRGISGGEKKRLSIAVELVTNPSIIFIDEPTSGLDSFNALQVIQTLASLARDFHKTVIREMIKGHIYSTSTKFCNLFSF